MVSQAKSTKYSFQLLILNLLNLGYQMCLENPRYLYLFTTHDVRVYNEDSESVYNSV